MSHDNVIRQCHSHLLTVRKSHHFMNVFAKQLRVAWFIRYNVLWIEYFQRIGKISTNSQVGGILKVIIKNKS